MAIGHIRGYKCSVDYYGVLRVPKNADRLNIKSAYRHLARDFHPDKKDGCLKAAEKMKQINAAHEVLIDPDMKTAYDAVRAKHVTRRACFCRIWNEQPDIWAQPEVGVIKAKSSITCHCENCDPDTKALKEKARSEAKRAKQETMEKERAEAVRLEQEKEEKERAQAERMEEERRETERIETERVQLEKEKESTQGEEKRLKQIEKLRLDIKSKQELGRRKAVAGPSRMPEGTTDATSQPEYSTYWFDHETMTPYYQSIREDFDRAMRMHKYARDQLTRMGSLQQLERQEGIVEKRWKDLEAKSREWADASSIANRLRETAMAQKRDSRS